MSTQNDSERVSTFRLVAGTPMRDLIRGRVTGRLDIEYLTESAGLPEPIREVVKQTVRRTRLMRIEKSDVARELIAHFRDGLDSGADAPALAASFGDTRVAAQLIRRAKKRDRSIAHKAMTRSIKGFGVLVLLLILTYGVLAIRYFGARPGPTVDYLPRLNAAALAVPEDDRAWPVYRESLLEHRPRQLQTDNTINLGVYPGWRNWERSVAYIREQAPLLDDIRRGASMRGMGYIARTGFTPEDQPLWPENAGGVRVERPALRVAHRSASPISGRRACDGPDAGAGCATRRDRRGRRARRDESALDDPNRRADPGDSPDHQRSRRDSHHGARD